MKPGIGTLCIAALLLFTSSYAFSQENNSDTSYWKNSLKTGANFNQTSFSENWTGGGNNAFSLGGLVYGKAYYNKQKISWNNEVDLQYGIVKNEDQSPRKTVDKIMLDSKLGLDISKNWNAYASMNYLSQFADGYRYTATNGVETKEQISGFSAPAFITSSWGLEYKPSNEFWMRLGPFSPRITLVSDTSLYNRIPENYGVPIGERVRYEWLAFQLVAQYEKDLVENISFKTKYQLFANYEEFTPKKTDHRIDVFLTAKVYKFINVSFTTAFLYDIDQAPKIQSSQQLGVGVLFVLGAVEK